MKLTSRESREAAWENIQRMHESGVHTLCLFPSRKTGGAVGVRPGYYDGGHSGWCIKAGTVDAYHSHDFDGALWASCGCREYGS